MEEGRAARGCRRGGVGPEDSLSRPPTTCRVRVAAFTTPRLPPAGAGWAMGAARGVGLPDWVEGEPRARPTPTRQASLPALTRGEEAARSLRDGVGLPPPKRLLLSAL